MFFKKKEHKKLLKRIEDALNSDDLASELEASWALLDILRADTYKFIKKEVLLDLLLKCIDKKRVPELRRTAVFVLSELFLNNYLSFNDVELIAFTLLKDDSPAIRRGALKIFSIASERLLIPISKLKQIISMALKDSDSVVRRSALEIINTIVSNLLYSVLEVVDLLKVELSSDHSLYTTVLNQAKFLVSTFSSNPDLTREVILSFLNDRNQESIRIGDTLLRELISQNYFKKPDEILPYLTKASNVGFLTFRDLIDLLISFEDFSRGYLLDFTYNLIRSNNLNEKISGLTLLANISEMDWVPGDLLLYGIDEGLRNNATIPYGLKLIEACFLNKRLSRGEPFERAISLLQYVDAKIREATIYTLVNMAKIDPRYAEHVLRTTFDLYNSGTLSKYVMLHVLFELATQVNITDDLLVLQVVRKLLDEHYEEHRRDEVASNLTLIVCRMASKLGVDFDNILSLFRDSLPRKRSYSFTDFKVNVIIEIASCLIENSSLPPQKVNALLSLLPENVVVSVLLPLLLDRTERNPELIEKYILLINNVIFESDDTHAKEKAIESLLKMYEKKFLNKDRFFSIAYALLSQQHSKEVPKLGLLLFENLIDKSLSDVVYPYEIKTLFELGMNNDYITVKNLTERIYNKFLESEILPYEKKIQIIKDWIESRYATPVKPGVARMLKQLAAHSLYYLIKNGYVIPISTLKDLITKLSQEEDAYIASLVNRINDLLS
ncbi:MAG: HEAT repeat domain-containing protein [Candidatus Asgardarchaeia archaeon]